MADTLTDSSGGALTAADWKDCGSFYRLDMIYTDTDGNGTTGIDIPIIYSSIDNLRWTSFVGGYIEMFTTNPGATAPTDNYDITIKKKTSEVDVFQGGLQNRDTANTETGWPLLGYEHPDDTLQLVVENNSQANATVGVSLYVLK